MSDAETTAMLNLVADKSVRQRDVAELYCAYVFSETELDWPVVNRAIMERWSEAGLMRIKRMVWGKA